jgi:16S rRNA (cytidine1402-2'-O)-methyltransferase
VANTASGRLYVVATPIGNLGDISARAQDTLRQSALIAAEDTRHSGALLRQFGIATPLVSLHEHNEPERAAALVGRLQGGESVALVSDAGTPAISDPGFALVRMAAAAGIEVVAIPGPCAAIAALSIAGLPTDRFCFEGFLPARDAARRSALQALAQESRTLVFYESPHRLAAALGDCVAAFGATRSAVIARELTKLHESLYRGTLGELLARALADGDMARGEIVLLIGGAPAAAAGDGAAELDRILGLLLAQLPLRQAAELAAAITGARGNEAYRRALHIKADLPSP